MMPALASMDRLTVGFSYDVTFFLGTPCAFTNTLTSRPRNKDT
jgi:hypothetical protein